MLLFTTNTPIERPEGPWSYGSRIYNYPVNQCLSPLMSWVRISIRARCRTLHVCDTVCQWFTTSRRLTPGTPESSTNKTDLQDITEILCCNFIFIFTVRFIIFHRMFILSCLECIYYLKNKTFCYTCICVWVNSNKSWNLEILLKVALNTIKQTDKINWEWLERIAIFQ